MSEVQYGIRITANAQGVAGTFDDVARKGDRAADAIRKIGHYGTGLLTLGALGQGLRGLVQQADAITSINARLQLGARSHEEYRAAQEGVFRLAQNSLAPLGETAQMYVRLTSAVRNLNGGQRETLEISEAVTRSLRISGASVGEQAAAILQFSQAMGSGRLQGDEFRSLMETAPRLMQALADGLGRNVGELKAMSSQGKLTADIIGNALLGQLGRLREESEKMPTTIGGAWQQVENSLSRYIGKANEASGASEWLARSLGAVAQNITPIADTALAAVAAGAAVGIGRLAASTVAYISVSLAKRQALIQAAQATLQAAAADEIGAQAKFAHAQRAVHLASGLQALTVVQQRLIPAQTALAAAEAAHAAAATRTAAVMSATGVAGALSRVLGILGGPVGLVVSLGLAAGAWFAFGRSAEQAVDSAEARLKKLNASAAQARAAGGPTPEQFGADIATINAQIAKARSGNQLSKAAELEALRDSSIKSFVTSRGGDPNAPATLSGGGKSIEELRKDLKTRTGIIAEYNQQIVDIERAFKNDIDKATAAGKFDEVRRLKVEMQQMKGTAAQERDSGLKRLDPPKQESDFERLRKQAVGIAAEANAAASSTDQLTRSEKMLAEVRAGLAENTIKLLPGQQAQIEALLETGNAAERSLRQIERVRDVETDRVRLQASNDEAYRRSIELIGEQADRDAEATEQLRLHNQEIGLSAAELRKLNIQRADDNVKKMESLALDAAIRDEDGRELQLLQRRVQAARAHAEEVRKGATKQDDVERGQENKRRADQEAQENKQRAEALSQQISSGLMRSFESGKDAGRAFFDTLKNMARTTILEPMLKPVVQPIGEAASQLSKGLTGWLGNLFSGGGAAASAAPAGSFPTPGDFVSTMVAHSGRGPGETPALRLVSSSTFDRVPRYHSGIGPGERAAIIRDDEGVFTPAQMKAMGAAGGRGGSQNVRVEIVNQGATPQQVSEVQPRFDAEGLVLRVVLRDLSDNGPIAQSVRRMGDRNLG